MTTTTEHRTSRGFHLVVEPATADTYGLRIEETNGSPKTPPVLLGRIRPHDLNDLAEIVLAALRQSGQPRTALGPARRKPISLGEAAGVRLALAVLAVEPVAKSSRRHAILAGIAAMSTEETYYWFARTTGPVGQRARRALRILLSDDGRTGIAA